jgi:hypothetical protein
VADALLIVTHFLIISTFSYLLYRFSAGAFKPFYWPSLIIKLLCGIAYGLLYKYYFNYGDTFSYYHQGLEIAEFATVDFKGYLKLLFFDHVPDHIKLGFTLDLHPRAYWFSKVISTVLLLTGKNYWITATYLSLFSFIGIKSIGESLLKITPKDKWMIIISFFLFPTFVLWSSGLTKESLAIGSLFYMISICLLVVNNYKIKIYQVLLFILFFWVEYKVRFFYLAAFLLTIGLFTVTSLCNKRLNLTGSQKIISALFLLTAFIIGVSQMDFTLNFSYFPEYLIHAYITDFKKNPSNAIAYLQLEPTYQSIMINSPLALISGLFRPSFLDVRSIPMIFVAMENFIILILFIFNFKRIFSGPPIQKAFWVYILILALFLAIASPNFGSLTRYKVAFLPFLLFLIMKDNYLINKLKELKNEKPD